MLDNGFQPRMRYPESRLDVAGFDASLFDAVRARVGATGIEFMTLTELQARDPDWQVKVHELYNKIETDIPFNMTLGYEPLPAWVDDEKTLGKTKR